MLALLNVTSLSHGDPPRFSGNFFASYWLIESLVRIEGLELHVATDGHTHDKFRELLPEDRCHQVAPARAHEGLLSILRRDYRLKKLVDKLRPDVFHRTTGQLPLFKLRHGAAVTTIADLNFKFSRNISLAQRFYKEMSFRSTFRRAVRVAAVSEYTAEEIVRHYRYPRNRITVTHHGVIPRPVGTLPAGLNDKSPFFLTFGHHPHKNCETAIRAFGLLRDSGKSVGHLVVVGMGGYVDEVLKPLSAELRLNDQVRFVGYVDDARLGALYSHARGLLFLSRLEGFGLPVVEAFEAQCPVVAAAATSLPEVVGDAGVLVCPDDASAVAETTFRIATDEEFRRSLIERGRVRASRFSWDEVARKTYEVYLAAHRDHLSAR